MLVDGRWNETWQPLQGTDADGGFVRKASTFRNWVTRDGKAGPTGEGGFEADANRYHLYVGLICPWASRTLMARALKGLEPAISVSVVEPELSDQGWRFLPGADVVNGATYLHEIYTRADARFTGRATVPVLWDRERNTIVNNESSDIVRMLNDGFGHLANQDLDLLPEAFRNEIDALNDRLYSGLNNGVYRAGFATTQAAYEQAFSEVFAALDHVEVRLARGGSYLFGNFLTETDLRLFVTLVRFDVAYHELFKCNLRRVADYPALSDYLIRMLAVPGIRGTVSIDHIKRGYHSIKHLNPTGIVPAGPDLPWLASIRSAVDASTP